MMMSDERGQGEGRRRVHPFLVRLGVDVDRPLPLLVRSGGGKDEVDDGGDGME